MRISTPRTVFIAVACMMAALAWPTVAGAQGFVSGSLGAAFGGSTLEDRATTFGGLIGGFGAAIGSELDLTFTPDFFTSSPLVDENSVTTVMGNLLIGPRICVLRPYVAGGVGLMRLKVTGPLGLGEFKRNDFAMNAGGGLIITVAPALGLRGDLRYYRNLSDDEGPFGLDFGDFDYWRSTGGVVIQF